MTEDNEIPQLPAQGMSAQEKLAKARREAKAAKLRLLAAALEAGEDVDDEVAELEIPGGGAIIPGPRRGEIQAPQQAANPLDLAAILGGGAQAMKSMHDMHVEDKTPTNAEGGEGFSFHRPAGGSMEIEIDDTGRRKVRYRPDGWPPKGEKF